MKATHTPGPWFVAPDNGRDCQECGETKSESALICWRPNNSPAVGIAVILTDAREQANARLIAAAPDLLAALESFVRWAIRANVISEPEDEIAIATARAAIAKASTE